MSKALSTQSQTEIIRSTGRTQPYRRTLADLAVDYMHIVAKKHRPGTVTNYTFQIRRFIVWLEGQGAKNAESGYLSPHILKKYGDLWTYYEKSGKYKASTVNNHLVAVRLFLFWLIAEGAVFDRSPEGLAWITETRVKQWLADVPDTSRPTRKERALSPDEVRCLLDAITDPRDLALFTLLAGSGLRVSECCSLRPADIEIRPDGAGIVHVLDGKGGKSRQVVISNSVIGHVYAWALTANFRLGDTTDIRSLWPNQRNVDKAIGRIRVYQLLQDYAKAAKINRHISPHTLRHTYGTERYRFDRDPVAVAEALGHSGLAYVTTYVKNVETAEAKPFVPEWEK